MVEQLQPCRCCGSPAVSQYDDYEICDACGWEDDPVQANDRDFTGGANRKSLNECRAQRPATSLDVR